ncbi:hypothetical protein A3765_28425 [Oleiphilus sp. HI0130]|nr:hypothetical protein A3765_29925 [Oleiphilus sp. HI0130]KZZ72478.1 hypothetical protein A3765_28425 [Oleiphilus sp. HI0130]
MKQLSFAVRRRFAKVSFFVLIATLFAVLGAAFFGEPQTANNLREAGIIIAPIIICLTTLVAQYSYLVYKTDSNE